MTDQPPTVGRIVHYVSHGSPVRADGTQAFTSECRAAIITEVDDAALGAVGLTVFNPGGLFFNQAVPHYGRADERRGGTWHWPERAPDTSSFAGPSYINGCNGTVTSGGYLTHTHHCAIHGSPTTKENQ